MRAFFAAAAAGDLEGALGWIGEDAWLAISAEAPAARRAGGRLRLPARRLALTLGRRGIARYLRLVRASFWREPLAVVAGERAGDAGSVGFAAAGGPGRTSRDCADATEWYGLARVHGGLILGMVLMPLPWRTVVPAASSRAATGAHDFAECVAREVARHSLPAAPPSTAVAGARPPTARHSVPLADCAAPPLWSTASPRRPPAAAMPED